MAKNTKELKCSSFFRPSYGRGGQVPAKVLIYRNISPNIRNVLTINP
jgi:hypothetical protein